MKKIINRPNAKILGSIIKMNRLHQNMSQKALSDGICVSSYLSRIENAEITPSEQVISELFDALAIQYEDSPLFIEEGTTLLNQFLDELMFNEFSTSKRIFEQIEARAETYKHSPLIIDYTVVKLAFYCTRKERDIFEATRNMLASVEDLMTNDQRFKYYLYDGIDHAKVYKDYEGSLAILNRAKTFDTNGHLYFWLAYAYLELSNFIKAFEMFTKALERYVEEANILSIIGTYEMLGLTHYRAGSYEEGILYFNRGQKLARKIESKSYVAAFNSNIAWGKLNLGDFHGALEIDRHNGQNVTSEFCVHQCITAFFANLEMENPMSISELLPQIREDNAPIMRLFEAVMTQSEVINWSEKTIDDEQYLLRLIEAAEAVNHELSKYLKNMMIRFYRSKRRYKEALELTLDLK